MLTFATSVHDVPFHDSVSVILPPGFSPPKAKAAVDVPAAPNKVLPELKSFFSVQELPFHDSFAADSPTPPKAKVASPSQIIVTTQDETTVLNDDILEGAPIEIRVYQ